MLITEVSILYPQRAPDGSRTFFISNNLRNILKIYPQQTLYYYSYYESKQVLLTPTLLKKTICLFRITLRNVEGALYEVSSLFGNNQINILISEDVRLGNVAIWEVIADFSNANINKEKFDDLLRKNSFITAVSSEKLFIISPDHKYLETPNEILAVWDSSNEMIKITLPMDILVKEIGVNWKNTSIPPVHSLSPVFW